MEQNTPLREIIPSLIRTYTPALVGAVLAFLASLGVDLDPEARGALITFLGFLFTAVYYTVARLMEQYKPAIGKILLGSAKQPVNISADNVVQLTAAKNAIESNEVL